MTKNEHGFSGALLVAEDYFETPFNIHYGILDNMELKIRWGFVYRAPDFGISDLKFSVKYDFFDKSGDKPSIFTEAGVSLPTGDHTKYLGTGGVGLSLGWYLIKALKPIEAFFGIAGEFNEREVLPGANPPKVFSYKMGARYKYLPDITLVGEIKGFNNYWNQPVGFRQELYLAPGIHYNWKMPISASMLIGLTGDSQKIGIYAETNFGPKDRE